MLVSSTLNASGQSFVHLIVIHHGDERVLVPVDLYAKYSDLQGFVTKEWALESQAFFFETDELNVCAGRRVRIHEEAWLGIKDIVGNVHVRVRGSDIGQSRIRIHEQNTLPATTERCELLRDEVLDSRQHSESAEEDEVEEQTRPDSQKCDYVVVTPTGSTRAQSSTELGHEGQKVPVQNPRKPTPEGGDTLNLFINEVDTEGAKEKEVQGDEQTTEPMLTKESSVPHKPSWKQFLGSGQRVTPNGTLNSSSSSTARTATVPPTPSLLSNGDIKTKSESGQLASDNGITGDTERVLIVVEPPPNNIYEARGFRIRREHSVRTVLKGASKAFKIDYTKARLRMIIEEEDGEALVTVKCNDADTMTSLKVEDNQRFIIEMVDEDEEEEEDSEH